MGYKDPRTVKDYVLSVRFNQRDWTDLHEMAKSQDYSSVSDFVRDLVEHPLRVWRAQKAANQPITGCQHKERPNRP